MLCENCGKNEANVRYTQIVNGVKKQMTLCEECAQKLGIDDMKFNMPINFSNFLGNFFDEYEEQSLLPNFIEKTQLECPKCKMNYNEFLENGKFGCDECYETFKEKIDPVIKNIHGANIHNGRIGKFLNEENNMTKINNKDIKKENKTEFENKETKKINNKEIKNIEEDSKKDKLQELKNKLKQEIKEEKYEDAAKTRDEIKNIENKYF